MQNAVKTEALSRVGTGRTCVLVLGMHRSGTSALTRVLSLLGCDLPKDLLGANPSNEVGHWESVGIMNLNNEILNSAGSNWHDWLAFNEGWYSSPKAEEYKEIALELLKSEFGDSRLFVLKDPRVCRFAPFWIEVLEAADVKPAIVTQVRNPLETAESLSRRNGFDPALGHLLWLRHVLEAEAGSRGYIRFHSSYDGLMKGWPRLVSEMQDSLDISWPRLSVMASEEIDAFLTEQLRHHEKSPDGVIANPFLSSWMRDAFAIFSRWIQEGESKGDYAALDRIRAELNSAAPAFARLILSSQRDANDLRSARRQIEEQQKSLDSLGTEHQAKAETEARLGNELKTVQSALEDAQHQLSETQGQLSQTQSALAQRSAEADEVTSQLKSAQTSLAEAESLARQETERATRLSSELEAERSRVEAELEAERSRAEAELDKLRSEKGKVEARLTDRFREIAILTDMLGDRERKINANKRLLDERKRDLDAKTRLLKQARKSEEQIALLQEVTAALLNGSGSRSLSARLASLLPASTRLQKHKERFKRMGIFDPDAYLTANPDVAEAGYDPLWHYLNFGIAEKRKLHPIQTSKGPKSDNAKQ